MLPTVAATSAIDDGQGADARAMLMLILQVGLSGPSWPRIFFAGASLPMHADASRKSEKGSTDECVLGSLSYEQSCNDPC